MTKTDILKLQQDLLSQQYKIKDLSMRYHISHQMVYDINNGKSWYSDSLEYPLYHKHVLSAIVSYCKDCGAPVTPGASYCKKCCGKHSIQVQNSINNYSKFLDNLERDVTKVIDLIVERGYEFLYREYKITKKTFIKYFTELNIDYHKTNLKHLYKQIHCIMDPVKRHYTKTCQSIEGKKIAMYRDDQLLKVFSSAVDAGNYLGDKSKNKHISSVCNGTRKTAYGYIWKYID